MLFAALAEERCETAAFAYLDGQRRVLGMRHVRSGARDWLDLPIRAVAADALSFDAAAVILAHNHPSGDPTPSAGDREATRLLARTLDAIEVELLDHLVVARGGHTSFRSAGLL